MRNLLHLPGRSSIPRVGLGSSLLHVLGQAIYARPRLRREVYRAQMRLSELPVARQLLLSLYRHVLPVDDHPQRMAVHIISACNMGCKYCYSDRTIEPLPIERWLALVDEGIRTLDIDFVQILGGEPLLHERLPWFLEELSRRRVRVALNTNGLLLSRDWLARLRPYRRRLMTFVNFDCQEHFGENTSADHDGSYDLVLANLRMFKRAGMHMFVFLTVTDSNADKIPEVVEQMESEGIGVVVERCVPVKPELEPLGVSTEQWQRLLSVLQSRGLLFSPNRFYGARQGRACLDYGQIIYLTQDGHALPCAFAPRELSVGNVEEVSLAEIWRRIRAEADTWLELPEECSACQHAAVCGGGCKTHVYLRYKRFDRRDPLCDGKGPPPTVIGL